MGEKMKKLMFLVLVILFVILPITFTMTFTSPNQSQILTFLILVGLIFLQGLRRIPADPPYVGILTFLGRPWKIILQPGWHILPLYPWLFGFIIIDIKPINRDLPPQEVMTPDKARLTVPISYTVRPDFSSFQYLMQYVLNGKEPGVIAQLDDIVEERVREWFSASEEGPQTWEQAIKSNEEAVAVLLKAILGSELPAVPSTIPTSILLKYFRKPQRLPSKEEAIEWGRRWEKVKEELERLSAEEQRRIETAVEERRKAIADIRQGQGTFKKSCLGVTLVRLNIGKIVTIGKLAEKASLEVEEEEERKGEIKEMNHLQSRIKELVGIGFTNEAALEIFQTERGKVSKTISENKWNISPETRTMIEKLAPALLKQLLGKEGE